MADHQVDSRLLEIFKKLIVIEGLSGNERLVADYITKFLMNLNLKTIEDNCKLYSKGNCGNLICKIGSGGNTAIFTHMDTARSTKNVYPTISTDRVHSDGTTVLGADNRAGIAIILYTIEKILKYSNNIPNVTLAFTICEETSLIGSDHIKLDNIEKAYVFDSALRPGNFIAQAYGAKNFKIKIYGKASHSGLNPEKGINAIQIAAKAINNLNLGKIGNSTTLNIGKISGGDRINVVPDHTIVRGEVRSLSLKSIETVIQDVAQKFKNATDELKGKFEIVSKLDFEPFEISAEDIVYQRLITAIEKVGLNPNPSISAGGSDANSLNKNGIPALNLGIGAQNPHSNDEFILLEDLQKSADLAFQLINIE